MAKKDHPYHSLDDMDFDPVDLDEADGAVSEDEYRRSLCTVCAGI